VAEISIGSGSPYFRSTAISAAVSGGASRAGEQHGEQIRGALRGVVHTAAEQGLLTDHER